ncbi:MAG TPA: HEAT repeat domain-containing protein [Pirellulales bacterium]|nr:HEAT repeat domain-containing protein [Pirellulales bacterium]
MYAPLAKVVSLLTPKRRWFQFSLLTMFAVVTIFGLWLGHWVDPASQLRRQLHDESEGVRDEAAKRLGRMGRKARTAESSLVAALKDESSDVRGTAAWALSQIGGDWHALVPLLDDEDVRLSAGKAIVRSGGDFRLVVRKLLDGGELDDILPSFGPNPTLAAIPVLIDAVSGDDAALKATADRILYENLPVPPASAVPPLIEYLAHPSPDARIAAAKQLLRLGTEARQAAGALRERLHDPDPRVALAMAAALGAVDLVDRESLAVLVEAVRSDDVFLRYGALDYCAALGPRAAGMVCELPTLLDVDPKLLTLFDVEKLGINGFALPGGWGPQYPLSHPLLRRVGPAALPLLRTILSRGSPSARLRAAHQLVNLGPRVRSEVPELVPVLTALLDDLDEDIQRHAVWVLGEIGEDASPVVPRLVKLIQSDDDYRRSETIEALRKIGVLDETTRSQLNAALSGSRPSERLLAARILAAGGVSAEVVLPTFVEFAQDDDPKTAADSLVFLAASRLGPAAAPTMDFLIAQLTTRKARDFEANPPGSSAAALLGRVGPAAVGRLVEVLGHPRPPTRALAAKALGEIGPAAADAVPRLISLLGDRSGPLEAWGWGNTAWLPVDWFPDGLPHTWSDPFEVRDLAIIALGRIGPGSRSAVPTLVRMLEEPWSEETDFHRLFAAWTLGRIGPDASAAIPALIRLAKRDRERPEATAVVALARIDPENRAVISSLKSYLAAGERRESLDGDVPSNWISEDLLDVVWTLGSRAEPLAAELHMVLAAPLLDPDNRCRAAFALASFPSERLSAVRYLEQVAAQDERNDWGGEPMAARLLEKLKVTRSQGH